MEWNAVKNRDTLGGKIFYVWFLKGAAVELVVKSYFHSFFKDSSSNIKLGIARAGNVIGGGDWAIDRIVPDSMRARVKIKIVEIRSPNSTRPCNMFLNH